MSYDLNTRKDQDEELAAAAEAEAAAKAEAAAAKAEGETDVETDGERLAQDEIPEQRMPTDDAPAAVTSLWPDNAVEEMRSRWDAVQLRFVDDPAAVAGEMQELVREAVHALTAALADQERDLSEWSTTGVHDTEQLRLSVQRYRDFYELMLSR